MAKTFSVSVPKGHYLLLLKNKKFPEYYWATGYTLNTDNNSLYSYGASQDTELIQAWALPGRPPMVSVPEIPLELKSSIELHSMWSKDKLR